VSQQLAAAEAFTAMIRVADHLYATERKSEFKEPLGRREVSDLGESVVQAASRGLQNPNPEVRRRSAETLQQAAVLFGELATSLSATDGDLKDVAIPEEEQGDILPMAKALADQGDFLARLLRDPEAQVRLTAAHGLEEMGNARTRFRRERGEGKDSPVEKALFRGLSAALPALSQSLSDPEPEVRLAAVEVLETLDSDAAPAAGALTKALADPNVFVRWSAARALSNIDPKQAEMAVVPLARVLFDPDFHARMAAAATLEKYGPPAKAAVPEMARAVDVGDAEIRVAVIRALEAVDPRDPRDAQPAIPALSKALAHPDVRVRRAAAEALSRFGPLARDAEPALRRALDDREDVVRKAAAEALINLNLKE
jgi:HEAT repeat protein